MTTLSVIVPVFREMDRINAFLAAHVPKMHPQTQWIVVDGDPEGATLSAILDDCCVECVTALPGRGRQINYGLDRAHGDTILILHADTILPDTAFEDIDHVVNTLGYDAGAFDVRFDQRGVAAWCIGWMTSLRARIFRAPYGDQALFFRRSVVDQIGVMAEWPLLEDVEYAARMRANRLRIGFVSHPVLTSARRWITGGWMRTTIKNRMIMGAYHLGVSPSTLAGWYRGS